MGGMLTGKERLELGDGRELRLLSALEVLQANREAAELAERGRPVFDSGRAVLSGMSAREIGVLAGRWAAFDRAENPSPGDGEERAQTLKKAWSTRLRSAFAGACSGHSARSPRRSGPDR